MSIGSSNALGKARARPEAVQKLPGRPLWRGEHCPQVIVTEGNSPHAFRLRNRQAFPYVAGHSPCRPARFPPSRLRPHALHDLADGFSRWSLGRSVSSSSLSKFLCRCALNIASKAPGFGLRGSFIRIASRAPSTKRFAASCSSTAASSALRLLDMPRPRSRADVRNRMAFARRRGWPRGTTSCCRSGVKRARQAQMRLAALPAALNAFVGSAAAVTAGWMDPMRRPCLLSSIALRRQFMYDERHAKYKD